MFAVVVLAGLFVYSVYEFRKPDEVASAESAPAPAPTPVVTLTAPIPVGGEAHLRGIGETQATGTAKRSKDKDVYYLRVKTNLPGIDRESQYYEVWLLRPIPYGYFSAGEMVTNDLGEFVLEWAGQEGKNYDDYSQVVITLEAKDGNPDPSGHVMEGMFE
jgi:hypothetical protein